MWDEKSRNLWFAIIQLFKYLSDKMHVVFTFAGDAERQWEEHVDQEALEVVENETFSPLL